MAFFLHKVQGNLTGDFWSFGLITQGSTSEAAAQGAWTNGINALWAAITTFMPPTATVTGTTTSTASATFRQTTKTSSPLALAGTSASVSLPNQCSTLLTLRTAQATRSGRGRMNLPPAAVNAVTTGGVMLPGYITALQTGATAMFNALIAGGLNAVLLNRTTNTTTLVTGGDIGNVFHTQKRRYSKEQITRTTFPL